MILKPIKLFDFNWLKILTFFDTSNFFTSVIRKAREVRENYARRNRWQVAGNSIGKQKGRAERRSRLKFIKISVFCEFLD